MSGFEMTFSLLCIRIGSFSIIIMFERVRDLINRSSTNKGAPRQDLKSPFYTTWKLALSAQQFLYFPDTVAGILSISVGTDSICPALGYRGTADNGFIFLS
jgi:hypothetical protein